MPGHANSINHNTIPNQRHSQNEMHCRRSEITSRHHPTQWAAGESNGDPGASQVHGENSRWRSRMGTNRRMPKWLELQALGQKKKASQRKRLCRTVTCQEAPGGGTAYEGRLGPGGIAGLSGTVEVAFASTLRQWGLGQYHAAPEVCHDDVGHLQARMSQLSGMNRQTTLLCNMIPPS